MGASPNALPQQRTGASTEAPMVVGALSARESIGLVGGGVIGAGWAARFLLNGHDCAVFDPDPDLARKLDAVVGNARRAQGKLMPGIAVPEGRLRIAASVADAVSGVDFIVESLPEVEELKVRVLGEIDRAARPGVGRWPGPATR